MQLLRTASLLLAVTLGVTACGSPVGSRPAATDVAALGDDLPGGAPLDVLPAASATPAATPTATAIPLPPLAIERMRERSYPGSDITIERELPAGANYRRYLASYLSDGLKIYAMLTIPNGEKPASGWPVVIFNHGYIPPTQYRTTERYVKYVDAFARNGYMVFKSDYRGHGDSEGTPGGGYGSPDYTVDVLNALASMRRHPDADPERIGMWGHSMGGQVTLRSMVVDKGIKAGVIWAGVVASYPDLFSRWRRATGTPPSPGATPPGGGRSWRRDFTSRYGTPEENPAFWAAISPNSFLADLSGPLQLHHGTLDHSVPIEFSELLNQQVKDAGGTVEYYAYEGNDHNISASLSLALQRSVAFFDKYVKGSG
jgi:dipeptidyl aminopeptidase/acylaminoacyl peptidase